MNKPFAQLLQRHLQSSGVKRVHLASVAGISYNYLTRLLSGTRNPSDQVIYNLARALHLSAEQTAELLSAAGFVLSPDSLDQVLQENQQTHPLQPFSHHEDDRPIHRIFQQFSRFSLEVPETLQTALQEEMQCLLSYLRYKYLFSGGLSVLQLEKKRQLKQKSFSQQTPVDTSVPLDLLSQIIGELGDDSAAMAGDTEVFIEDILSTIDRFVGNLLTGEIQAAQYQPQLVVHMLDILRNGTPWEIRRRITEALPSFCRLDLDAAEHLIEEMRTDCDEHYGVDIRRRVIEALPDFFEATPQSTAMLLRFLQPRSGDDIYVALATIEVSGDIHRRASRLTDQDTMHRLVADIARIQRHLLLEKEGIERECLQFALALTHLLPDSETFLISVQEGLQAHEVLLQLAAVRALERALPARPHDILPFYQRVLATAQTKNVRRAVARSLPAFLRCLQETSLSIRTLARAVILALAQDPDLPIRRAVADHARQLFQIDREFLLVLLQQMPTEKDEAIRHRLRPVALQLAQVWLTWYAETAKLLPANPSNQAQAMQSIFGE